MNMKTYKNRNQLLKDVLFVKSILLEEKYKSFIVGVLFDQWLSTAEDSPWYANEEENFTETPVKINGSAVFGSDVKLPEMLYGTVRHSDFCGGKIKISKKKCMALFYNVTLCRNKK